MPIAYYRLSPALLASLSLMLTACAQAPSQLAAVTPPPKPGAQPADPMHTDATLWTILHLAKKPPPPGSGPKIGGMVSPVLWKAARDTLSFVPLASEDSLTGVLATEWYSPPDKPDERFKVFVYILSRALLSSSLAVRVERQMRSPQGQWVAATVDDKTDVALEAAILDRARQIWHAHIVNQS